MLYSFNTEQLSFLTHPVSFLESIGQSVSTDVLLKKLATEKKKILILLHANTSTLTISAEINLRSNQKELCDEGKNLPAHTFFNCGKKIDWTFGLERMKRASVRLPTTFYHPRFSPNHLILNSTRKTPHHIKFLMAGLVPSIETDPMSTHDSSVALKNYFLLFAKLGIDSQIFGNILPNLGSSLTQNLLSTKPVNWDLLQHSYPNRLKNILIVNAATSLMIDDYVALIVAAWNYNAVVKGLTYNSR